MKMNLLQIWLKSKCLIQKDWCQSKRNKVKVWLITFLICPWVKNKILTESQHLKLEFIFQKFKTTGIFKKFLLTIITINLSSTSNKKFLSQAQYLKTKSQDTIKFMTFTTKMIYKISTLSTKLATTKSINLSTVNYKTFFEIFNFC